jgi:hypothetical protein
MSQRLIVLHMHTGVDEGLRIRSYAGDDLDLGLEVEYLGAGVDEDGQYVVG